MAPDVFITTAPLRPAIDGYSSSSIIIIEYLNGLPQNVDDIVSECTACRESGF